MFQAHQAVHCIARPSLFYYVLIPHLHLHLDENIQFLIHVGGGVESGEEICDDDEDLLHGKIGREADIERSGVGLAAVGVPLHGGPVHPGGLLCQPQPRQAAHQPPRHQPVQFVLGRPAGLVPAPQSLASTIGQVCNLL